jgi:hypothetical protein
VHKDDEDAYPEHWVNGVREVWPEHDFAIEEKADGRLVSHECRRCGVAPIEIYDED